MSEPKSIGGDWVESVDPGSGRTYYANTKTNATSWTWPDDVPKPAGSDDDWQEQTDPTSGNKYFYNAKTGETSWTDPRSSASTEEKAEDWAASVDPGSGKTYYYNAKTQQTTWDKPAILVAAEAKKETADAPAPAPAAAAAPSPAPAAAAPAPAPAAAATGAGGAAGAADAAAEEKGLSDKSKDLWRKVLSAVKVQASTKITSRNNKFARLRHFGLIKRSLQAGNGTADADGADGGSGGGGGGGDAGGGGGAGGGAGAGLGVAAPATSAPLPKRSVLKMLKADIPDKVEEMEMEEYAQAYFKLNRKGLFNKKTTTTKILNWKADVIKTALRAMQSKDLAAVAVQCFRNVTGYMGDRSTHKEGGGHAYKLLANANQAAEELRDEIYCQLIKQTTNNPKPESLVKGWQLFAICTGAFPPSAEFEPYLMSYLDKHRNDPLVGAYATFSLGRVAMATNLGPRREVPTQIEVEAVKEMKAVVMRVYNLDASYNNVPVTSWTTMEHLNDMMAVLLGLKNKEAFACYEMTSDGEERYLEPNDRVLDLVAYWQRLFEEEHTKKQKKKVDHTNMYRLVYKVHMYLDRADCTPADIKQTYIQAVFDVVSSKYPCEEEDCVQLAALQLQNEFGDDAGKGNLSVDKIKRYVPKKFLGDSNVNASLVKKIIEARTTLGKMEADKAMDSYLKYVKGWKIYGSAFFYVEPQSAHTHLPESVFLAVNPKGVLLINFDTKEILAEHPYSEVPTWGFSSTTFVLHIGNLVRQTKIYFQTMQGKEINDLVRAYVNHACLA